MKVDAGVGVIDASPLVGVFFAFRKCGSGHDPRCHFGRHAQEVLGGEECHVEDEEVEGV